MTFVTPVYQLHIIIPHPFARSNVVSPYILRCIIYLPHLPFVSTHAESTIHFQLFLSFVYISLTSLLRSVNGCVRRFMCFGHPEATYSYDCSYYMCFMSYDLTTCKEILE